MGAARGLPSLHLACMFGVRLGADGRVMYGVEYEDASGNGGRMLQWQPVLAWSDGASISAGMAPAHAPWPSLRGTRYTN